MDEGRAIMYIYVYTHTNKEKKKLGKNNTETTLDHVDQGGSSQEVTCKLRSGEQK